MPLDRGQDLVNENVEDDGEDNPLLGYFTRLTRCKAMPPLVDNPSPNYTFLSEMTTLSFTSTPAPSATQANSPQPTVSFPSSPALSPTTSEEPASMVVAPPRTHGKKRDASYIPRPPNAFILFRCAFIKEQNVPGKVEGNHSRLSKIIGTSISLTLFYFRIKANLLSGLCWKQLPQEERDKWEAKAVEAQAEHRAQYPDWRFRPASNAMSKPKAKDAGEGTSRPRSVHGHGRARDQQQQELPTNSTAARSDAKGKGKERGSAKAKTTHPLSFEEVRCAKIAELVAEGLKGDDLEIAVREWEGKHRLTKAAGPKASKSKARSRETRSTSLTKLQSDVASTSRTSRRTSKRKPLEKATEGCLSTSSQSSPTPTQDSVPNAGSSEPSDPRPTQSTVVDPGGAPVLPDVPLTQMYRRSSSVPTSHNTLSRVSSSTVSSEDSSTDKISTTSAERSPTTWGSLKSAVPQDVEPTRTHNPSGLDTISFSIPSKTTTFDSSHHLTWQEAESRRRIEESQEPNSWWAQRSQATDSRFIYNQSSAQSSNVLQPLSASGFGVASGGSHSNNGYVAVRPRSCCIHIMLTGPCLKAISIIRISRRREPALRLGVIR